MRRFVVTSKEIRANAVQAVNEITSDPVMEITIKEYKHRKTDEQRGWFHTLCGMLGKETGYSQEEIKEIIKREALGVSTITMNNLTYEVVNSSEKANREQYSHLIDTIYRIAGEMGYVLPNPDLRKR